MNKKCVLCAKRSKKIVYLYVSFLSRTLKGAFYARSENGKKIISVSAQNIKITIWKNHFFLYNLVCLIVKHFYLVAIIP